MSHCIAGPIEICGKHVNQNDLTFYTFSEHFNGRLEERQNFSWNSVYCHEHRTLRHYEEIRILK